MILAREGINPDYSVVDMANSLVAQAWILYTRIQRKYSHSNCQTFKPFYDKY